MNALNEKGLEWVLETDNLRAALKKVKANDGAPGIDGMGTSELEDHLKEHWPGIRAKLLGGTYQPSPVRPVTIPKPGGGQRELGIPTSQDRYIQQAIATRVVEVFEPVFSDNSYGYRAGRSQHDAVREMKRLVVGEGKAVVIDIDIKGFFDEVDHDVLMRELGREVTDKGVRRLIGAYLRAGKLVDNRKVKSRGKGMPQGGPLSPVLANIYLTPLDRELERRGLSFLRYADDIVIFVKSGRAAERILPSLVKWIAKHLKVEVHPEKSGHRDPWEGNFLGYRVERDGRLAISRKNIARFREKVRWLLDARRPWTWTDLLGNWTRYIVGWTAYHKLSEWYEFQDLGGWCRRHVRKLCWLRWHNWRGRRAAFKRLKANPMQQRMASCSRGAWRMARHPVVQCLLTNKRLLDWGFVTPSDLAGGQK